MTRGYVAVRRWLPGLGLLAAVAAAAQLLRGDIGVVSLLLLAVALGAAVANGPGVPAWARPGVAGHALLLEIGIVLLGARLAVNADEHQLAYVVATVVLFDALTLVLFPLVGSALALPERAFGVWAGLAMFSTGPATAVGFSMGPTAGEFTTLAKLPRNAFIGAVAAGYAVGYGRSTGRSAGLLRTAFGALPRFLVGFLLVMLVANLGVLSAPALARVNAAADIAFQLAFAGLGLTLPLASMRRTGLRPVVVVGGSLPAMGMLSLLVATRWF